MEGVTMNARMLTCVGLAAAVVLFVAITIGQDSTPPQVFYPKAPSTLSVPAASATEDVALASLPRDKQDSPIGSWSYSTGPFKVELNIAPDTLNGTFSMPIEDVQIEVDFHGEYSVTSEKLLYGVIQSADIRANGISDEDSVVEVKAIAARLIEQPFAVRIYVHDSVLMVKDVNLGIPFALSDDEGSEALATMFVGRYSRSES
jgi:hypothetical protein